MISLKKYLEMEKVAIEQCSESDPSDLLCAGLESYRTTLIAAGEAGGRACPPTSGHLPYALGQIAKSLDGNLSWEVLTEAGVQATNELRTWADQSVEYFDARTEEVKELLLVVARTAASVGERDKRYAEQFNRFSTRLSSVSTLQDLNQVRTSLMQQAAELKSYVDQMNAENQELVKNLQVEVKTYEDKLKKTEQQAFYDGLTGLPNRRYLEQRIDFRINRGQPFSVVMLDVNRLKQVNDRYGHLAGDSLLRQFSQELRSALRSADDVGRWGGDEFLLVVDGDAVGVQSQITRLQRWAFGQYTIRPGRGSEEVKVETNAAIGVAEWQPGRRLAELIESADAEMYKQKRARESTTV